MRVWLLAMGVCKKCEKAIKIADYPLMCGSCGCLFHCTCTTLNRVSAKIINENANVLFRCEECLGNGNCNVQSVSVSDGSLMREEMKAIAEISASIASMRDDIAAQIQSAIECAIESVKESVLEKFQMRIDNLQSTVASKLDKFENNLKNNFEFEKNLTVMNRKRIFASRQANSESGWNPRLKTRILTNKDDTPMQIDVETNANDDEVFLNNQMTFADAVKNKAKDIKKPKKKNRKARPVIVIKPGAESQNCDDTRNFLKQTLDPKIHNISNFRNGKDGSIIVECAIGANVDNVKNDLENSLGNNYSAVIPKPVRPRLKITGMSDKYSSEEFIDLLKAQNKDIGINEVKVIASYENPHFKFNKFNVVFEVDTNTYKCLKVAKKVKIGWDVCPVYDAFGIIRCFKCGEFGHRSTDCKNKDTCSKCSDNHRTSDCVATEFKCINCSTMNAKVNLNLDVNHAGYSFECSVYKKKLEHLKGLMQLSK